MLVVVLIAFGCRQSEPVAVPIDVPGEIPASREAVTDQQLAAIEAIEQAGGSVALDDAGLPTRIDLASDRVFANEEVVRAVLEFPEVRVLRLAVTSVSMETLAELAILTQLEELLLQDAALGDEQLGQLLAATPGLKRLTLRRLASVTDAGLEAVVACPALEVLALIEMNQVSDAGLDRLTKVERLRSLDLRNCGQLTVEDFDKLASLGNLAELKLAGSMINDSIVDSIARLETVRSLTIEDTEISGEFFTRLAQDQPVAQKMHSLAFARCFGVTDDALAPIADLPNLQTLVLRDILVSGQFLTDLAEQGKTLPTLTTLTATNAFLDDAAVGHLPKVAPNLERLDLRGNTSVTDESAGVFKKLTRLRELRSQKLQLLTWVDY